MPAIAAAAEFSASSPSEPLAKSRLGSSVATSRIQ